MDYRKYQLNAVELTGCIAAGILISGIAAWLLYRSWFGMLSAILFIPLCIRARKRQQLTQRRQKLLLQFRDSMQSVAAALLSGYSMENAWRESEQDMLHLYGADAYMVMELKQINAAVKMNQPIEQVLYRFAVRSGCEDIISFAEVFQFAKKSGGNFGKIIQTTVRRISGKIEVEREISTMISGRKMEQKIMNMVPVLLIFYLNLTSGEFMEPLYGNLFGVLVMSFALAAYLGAVVLSEKIMRISV